MITRLPSKVSWQRNSKKFGLRNSRMLSNPNVITWPVAMFLSSTPPFDIFSAIHSSSLGGSGSPASPGISRGATLLFTSGRSLSRIPIFFLNCSLFIPENERLDRRFLRHALGKRTEGQKELLLEHPREGFILLFSGIPRQAMV